MCKLNDGKTAVTRLSEKSIKVERARLVFVLVNNHRPITRRGGCDAGDEGENNSPGSRSSKLNVSLERLIDFEYISPMKKSAGGRGET